MGQWLVLFAAGEPAARRAEAAAATLGEHGWHLRRRQGGMTVWTCSDRPPTVRSVEGGGVALGEVFGQGAADGFETPPQMHLQPFDEPLIDLAALRWSRRCWGAHVVVWPRPRAAGLAIYRDATGAEDALVWRLEGVTVVSSALEGPGLAAVRPRLSVHTDRVAAMLGRASEIGGELALETVQAVAPGQLLRPGHPTRTIWSPASFATSADLTQADESELAEGLRTSLAGALAAVGDPGRPLVAEISGGLDSAIIAQSLGARTNVRAWLHVHAGEDEGDERSYARAVADHLGVALTQRARLHRELSGQVVDEVGLTARPALSAMDAGYEATVLGVCAQAQAWGVITGQGGDTAFYSMAAPAVAADRGLRAEPRRRRALIRSLALELGTSIWSVGRRARAAERPTAGPQGWAPLFGAHRGVADLRRHAPTHPWLRAARDVPAAKRVQIEGLAYNLLAYGACRRTRAVRLIHGPLLQPVLEFCLATPAHRLVPGGRDRGLARSAFARTLPRSVITRRSKGDLTRVYGRELAQALPFVRDRLLDGGLRSLGLLDVSALEARLTPEALMWRGGYGDVMELLAIETWVRTVTASGG